MDKEKLLEELSDKYWGFLRFLQDKLKDIDEAELNALLSEEVNSAYKDYPFHKELIDSIRNELNFRLIIGRTKEINADFYCVYHDCDTKKCPDDGIHIDEEEYE